MSLAESVQDRTQLGRAGQGSTEDPQRGEKVGDVAARILFMDISERLLIQSSGLVGIFKLKGWGSLIAAVFLDHFWKEYKNVVSKSGQEANGYRRGETVSFPENKQQSRIAKSNMLVYNNCQLCDVEQLQSLLTMAAIRMYVASSYVRFLDLVKSVHFGVNV